MSTGTNTPPTTQLNGSDNSVLYACLSLSKAREGRFPDPAHCIIKAVNNNDIYVIIKH